MDAAGVTVCTSSRGARFHFLGPKPVNCAMLMLTWRTFGAGQLLSFENVSAPSARIGNGFKSWKSSSPAACLVLKKATPRYRLRCACLDQPAQAR
jgi:hypothetical protein